jgi:uncharacterized integral membrane protein
MMLLVSEMTVFKEIQKFRQKWVLLIVGIVALLTWWAFIQQVIFNDPFGDNPAPDYIIYILTALFGIGLPAFIFGYRMETTITADFILVKMTLLGKKLIRLENIDKCYRRQYRPLMEYGGWGWRWSPTMGIAYNVSGSEGVQLELKGGKKILIGSQQAQKLADKINELRKD